MNQEFSKPLLPCGECSHAAEFHDGTGCQAGRCRCASSKDRIIEDAIRDAIAEQNAAWEQLFDRSAMNGRVHEADRR